MKMVQSWKMWLEFKESKGKIVKQENRSFKQDKEKQ